MTRRQLVLSLLIGLTLGSVFTTYKALRLARYASDVTGQALDLVHKKEAQTAKCLDALEYVADAIDWSQQDVCE